MSVKKIFLDAPAQKIFGERAVPAVLVWEGAGSGAAAGKHEEGEGAKSSDEELQAALQWIATNKEFVSKTLLESGAILFRNFPLPNATCFDSFVQAFDAYGYEDLPYEKSLSFAVRLPVVGRVCTTNEGKTGGMMFHHEQAQAPYFPSKLFFYCEKAADEGGATGICSSDLVLSGLRTRYPDFVGKCERLGVQYTATLTTVADTTVGVGRTWMSFFGKDTVEGVEARMRELGYTWVWEEQGQTLRMTTPVLPAVRTIPGTTTKAFFNQMVATLGNARDFSKRSGDGDASLSKFLRFGDGSEVPREPLEYARELCDEVAVELQWQAGDVGLLDNYAVMHARRAFEGTRKVYASLAV